MIPDGIGTAIAAIWSSGAKGTDALVLVCLAHSLDWRSMDGATGIPSLEIASRIGMARSVVVESLGRLEFAGVVEVAPFVNGRPKSRRVRWDVLASYTSPETKRGGVRTPDPSEHRTRPNIGQEVSEHRTGTPPNIGQDLTEHRTLIVPPPPEVVPVSSMETRAPEVAPSPKPKRTKPSPDQASDSERADWDDLLGAYAEIDPDGARRIDSGRSTGLAREALALLRAGPDVAVRRLRYLARGPGRDAEFARRPDGPRGSALLRRSSAWCATVDDAAAAWADRASMLAAQPTDARWRDPGWAPTRTAARQQTPPGKPPESITERALTVHELARQLQENRHAARDHRHDDRDLLALEGSRPQAPGGVARRTG